MVNKFRRFFHDFFSHNGKILYFSFYLSLLLHLYLIAVGALPLVPADEVFCGVDEIVSDREKQEIVLNFELDPGDFLGEKNPGAPGMGRIQATDKNKETGGGSPENFLEKFKGTEWETLAKNLENTKELRKNFGESYDDVIPNSGVSQKYIKRYRHFEDMVVKDVYPTLDSIDKKFDLDIEKSEEVLEKHVRRNEIIEDFRNSEDEEVIKLEFTEKKIEKKSKSPLVMDEAERTAYLDKILTEPKEKQIANFIDKFADFDPDTGDLPFLFRDLYYKNLQRLAYSFSADPTYFTADYFEENLNKEDYLRNSMALASKTKGSKTSIEILFTILDIYEIQERALEQYFKNLEIQKNLSVSQKKEIRNETIRMVLEKYTKILKEKNINSLDDVKKMYFKKKISLLDFMDKNNSQSYRAKDITFEKGRILWERGMSENSIAEISKAISIWKLIPRTTSIGDFTNKKNFENIEPLFPDFENNANQIHSHILNKWRDHLDAKRLREEKLLWGRD